MRRVRLNGMTTDINIHQSQQAIRHRAGTNNPRAYQTGAEPFAASCPLPVYRAPNAVMVLSASGGLDADISGGCLDILLGMESDLGVLLNAVTAPLGEVDGVALRRRLATWDGVGILSSRPWIAPMPQDWEIAVTVCALADMYDTVVVDAGRAGYTPGQALPLPIKGAAIILLVELSVLGTARAHACIEALTGRGSRRSPDGQVTRVSRSTEGTVCEDDIALVGVLPPAVRATDRGVVGAQEAAEYLGIDMVCSIRPDTRLCAAALEGAGALKPNRANAKALRAMVSWLDTRAQGMAQ